MSHLKATPRGRRVLTFLRGTLFGATLALSVATATFLASVPTKQVATHPFLWVVSAAVLCLFATLVSLPPLAASRRASVR